MLLTEHHYRWALPRKHSHAFPVRSLSLFLITTVSFVEVFSGEGREAQEFNRLIMSESNDESKDTPRPRKKGQVTLKKLSQERAQVLVPHEFLPCPFASQADFYEK